MTSVQELVVPKAVPVGHEGARVTIHERAARNLGGGSASRSPRS